MPGWRPTAGQQSRERGAFVQSRMQSPDSTSGESRVRANVSAEASSLSDRRRRPAREVCAGLLTLALREQIGEHGCDGEQEEKVCAKLMSCCCDVEQNTITYKRLDGVYQCRMGVGGHA